MKTVYTEKQQFRQWWIWLLLSPLIVVTFYVVIKQLVLGEAVGDNPMLDFGVILFALFSFGIVSFIWFLKLETRIDEDGISMNYRPVLKRHYAWRDIAKTEIIDYGFVGYGFRWWPKHGWIYNIGGDMGLKIYLKSGKHFIIGTQKAQELKSFMAKESESHSSATS